MPIRITPTTNLTGMEMDTRMSNIAPKKSPNSQRKMEDANP